MSTWLDTPGVRKRPFCGQDHLVTALAGENAGLAVTLNRGGSALPPLAASPVYGQHHPVDMTIVCIDILEKNFGRESQIERTAPLIVGHGGIRAGWKLKQS
jgi:hypothetical protein